MLWHLRFIAVSVLFCFRAVQAQSYGTPPACTSLNIDGTSLPAGVEQCTSFTGEIHLTNLPVTDLSPLRNVRSASQVWIETSPDLLDVTMPALESTQGNLIIWDHPKLLNIDLPKYTGTFGGQIVFTGCPELLRISVPQVTYCNSWFEIRNVPKCSYINAQRLANSGGVAFQTTGMTRIALPKLTLVRGNDFELVGNAKLTQVDIPLLTRIESTFMLVDNAQLTSFSLSLVNWINIVRIEMPVTFKMIHLPELAWVDQQIRILAPGLTALDFPKLVLGSPDAFDSAGPHSYEDGRLEVADVCCTATTVFLTQLGSTKLAADACRVSGSCYCPGSNLLTDPRAYFPTPVDGLYGNPTPEISCKNGYVVNGTAPTCELTGEWTGTTQSCVCQGNRFPIGNSCRTCPKGCATCEACPSTDPGCLGGVRCLTCQTGWTDNPMNGVRVCCAGATTCASQNRLSCLASGLFGDFCGSCKPGYRQEGTSCVACPPGCQRCDATTCFECAQYHTMDQYTGFCCVGNTPCDQVGRLTCAAHGGFCGGCREGFYNDRGMCKACPWPCQNCTGPTSCEACLAPNQLNAGMCCDTNCLGKNAGICAYQGGQCGGCPPGKFLDSSYACVACPATCATCTGKECSTCQAGYVIAEGLCCNANGAASCTALARLPCTVSGESCGDCLPGYSEQGGICKCSATCLNGGTCATIFDEISSTLFGGCKCPTGFTGRTCENRAHVQIQDTRSSLMLGDDRAVGLARTDQGTLLFSGTLASESIDVQGPLATPAGDITGIFPQILNVVGKLQYEVVQPQPVNE